MDNWSRGIWTTGPPSKAPQGYLTRMINVLVMDEGTIATRSGCLHVLPLANTVDGVFIAGLHFYKIGTAIYDLAGGNTGIIQPGNQLAAAAAPTIGVPNDLIFFPTAMKKYYQGVVSNWGITSIPAAPVSGAGAGTLLTGNYSYKTAFVNSITHTISPLSPESNITNIVAGGITVSNLPLTCPDVQADTVYLYRTQGGIPGAWYFLDSVPLGTATYADNISDAGLAIDPVDNNMIAPPAGNVAGRYKNVMLLADTTANPRFVYPSLASQPEEYDVLVLEQVMDAGDTAVAIIEMGDYAVVFGRRGIYFFQQDPSGVIYTAKVVSGKGTTSGNTISMGDAGVYFLSEDGVYVMAGANVTKVSDNIDALFRGKDRGGLSLIANYQNVSGDFIGGRYYLTYPGTDGQQHTVVFNERKARWKHYTGWNYTVNPDSGVLPIVGLAGSVALHDWAPPTDDGNTFVSEVGFNLQSAMTALMELRTFRLGLECAGTVTVEFYEDTTLMYSIDLTGLTFEDSYKKYSLPLGVYFLQPEVRIKSSTPFTLKMFEADVNYVRKYEADYTRTAMTTPTTATGSQ